MTIKSLAKLSVFALLINYIGKAEADSFSLAVRGTACADVSAEQTRSEIRYRAYDKAVLLAVKKFSVCPAGSSQYGRLRL